jgi:hypothetical protein
MPLPAANADPPIYFTSSTQLKTGLLREAIVAALGKSDLNARAPMPLTFPLTTRAVGMYNNYKAQEICTCQGEGNQRKNEEKRPRTARACHMVPVDIAEKQTGL